MPTTVVITLTAILIASLGLVWYTYFVYPALIYVASRLFGRPPVRPLVPSSDLPTVTLVIAAYNEAVHIRERIENALAADYPADKYDIVIASDGSSDETVAIAREYVGRGVRVVASPARRGKASVLNDAIPAAAGEVVVLSDANTNVEPAATRHLAAWFADPDVGAVCGRLVLTDPVAGRNVDSLYWKYETFLKKCESRLGALLGSNGGIYAIRKSVFDPVSADTLVEDFVIPLAARARTGCRIVYDRDAVACEETPDSMVSEFHRRARIGAGGFQSMTILWPLLHPRHGWVAFTFLSHKVLRWSCPFFLFFAIAANVLCVMLVHVIPNMPSGSIVTALLGVQAAFYACALMSGYLPGRPRVLRVLKLPAMFTMMNAALAVGFWRWLVGSQKAAWRRTDRAGIACGPQADLIESGSSRGEVVLAGERR